jgi:polysaccharide biosynthesis/export protein
MSDVKMIRYYTLSICTAILSMCALTGAQSGPATTPDTGSVPAERAGLPKRADTADVQLKQRDPRYQVKKSDAIDVKFKFSPEFDQVLKVQPDGFITLDQVGDIKVEGKTIPELKEAVRIAYQGILHDPVITVSLVEFEHPFFLAAGQVKNPGKFELRSDTTLIEAVTIAGGFTDASKHSQVVLFRRVSNEMVEAKVFNVKQMLGSRNLQEDPHLMPGDMLFVPQNKMSKIQRYIPTPGLGMFFNPSQL